MRIACLQFSPQLGKVEENIARANFLLERADTSNLDLLVLPELAFSGYNFPSLSAIKPFLEVTAIGPSTCWAKSTAERLNCLVSIGYPEDSIENVSFPQRESIESGPNNNFISRNYSATKHYNSTITVSPDGRVIAHYRKTHLYYTDETWAQESPTGWLTTSLPLLSSRPKSPARSTRQLLTSTTPRLASAATSTKDPSDEVATAFGICMDLNSYKFEAEWNKFEFVTHVLASSAKLVICSMAWLTHLPLADLRCRSKEPDLGTLTYWISRLQPLVYANVATVVALANRCGVEEEDARYAGTSVVMELGHGKARIWGLMGRGEEGLLKVDTSMEARQVLRWEKVNGEESGHSTTNEPEGKTQQGE